MDYHFVDQIPLDLKIEPIVISGSNQLGLQTEYLVLCDEYDFKTVFEIKYEYHCSPFKQAEKIDSILLIGHEEYFYLIDLKLNSILCLIKMAGYFGYIYIDSDLIYVADSCDLYCVDKIGQINWKTSNLGIDGVIINHFDADKIVGEGEFDPPGGWINFILDKETGKLIT